MLSFVYIYEAAFIPLSLILQAQNMNGHTHFFIPYSLKTVKMFNPSAVTAPSQMAACDITHICELTYTLY